MTQSQPEQTSTVTMRTLRRVTLLREMMYDLQAEILDKPEPDETLLGEFEHVSRSFLLAVSR